MIMKKIYLLAAVALVALASCTSDEFVGENNSPNPVNNNGENEVNRSIVDQKIRPSVRPGTGRNNHP